MKLMLLKLGLHNFYYLVSVAYVYFVIDLKCRYSKVFSNFTTYQTLLCLSENDLYRSDQYKNKLGSNKKRFIIDERNNDRS